MSTVDAPDVRDVMDARSVMDAMLDARRSVKRARVTDFQLAATFADLNAVVPIGEWSIQGCERLVQIGGDGTPEVAEFCLLELAARLGMTADAARVLVGNALSVRHRLPRAWDALDELRIEVWQAHDLAGLTHDLCRDDARRLDAHLAGCYGTMSWKRIKAHVEGLKVQLDPTLARDERTRRLARRTVDLGESSMGFTDLFAVLDTELPGTGSARPHLRHCHRRSRQAPPNGRSGRPPDR